MPKFQCKAQTPQRRFCFARPQKTANFYPFTCIPPLLSARRFSVIENETAFFLSFFSLYTSFLIFFYFSEKIHEIVCLIILCNYTICNMVCKELFLKTLPFLLYNHYNCCVVFFIRCLRFFTLQNSGFLSFYTIQYKGFYVFRPLLWLQKEGNASIFLKNH